LLIDTYSHIPPNMQKVLNKLGTIPIDIEPIFPLVKKKPGSIR
jgi:hypothetical protein